MFYLPPQRHNSCPHDKGWHLVMATQRIKIRRQWQMPRKEHAGVNCQKTILQIIKEDRVIKMDKELLRNKHTGKNFSCCFHFQMPKDNRYKKWAYHKTLRRVLPTKPVTTYHFRSRKSKMLSRYIFLELLAYSFRWPRVVSILLLFQVNEMFQHLLYYWEA